MRKTLMIAAAFAMPLTAMPAFADDHVSGDPEMLEQDWYRVNAIKFKPGNRERIGEILEMFGKADKAAGVDGPTVVHMNTGAWDMLVFFKMKHGIKQMGWNSTPEGDAWDKAFADMVGGEDAAKEIFAEFQSFVANEQSHIGHIHEDDDEES